MNRILAIFFLTALFAATVARAEPNPAYAAWAKFKPGSSVTLVGLNRTGGLESTIEFITTLIEVTPTKVVVETRSTYTLYEVTTKRTVRNDILSESITGTFGQKIGTEKLTIQGQNYECVVWEKRNNEPKLDLLTRTWVNDSIPGGIVKMRAASQGAVALDTTWEMNTFSAK